MSKSWSERATEIGGGIDAVSGGPTRQATEAPTDGRWPGTPIERAPEARKVDLYPQPFTGGNARSDADAGRGNPVGGLKDQPFLTETSRRASAVQSEFQRQVAKAMAKAGVSVDGATGKGAPRAGVAGKATGHGNSARQSSNAMGKPDVSGRSGPAGRGSGRSRR
jgi:hypothetical protein